jgi:hypothetical protein
MFVAGLSLGMVAPAFADAQFYGSLRYDTFYVNQKSDGVKNIAGDDSVTTLKNGLAGNSRFGVKFTQGDLFGQFEAGIKDYSGSNKISTRLMYGTYKFNGGSLVIGQTYTPWKMFTAQAYGDDNGNKGFGALYDSRQPQIKLTMQGFFLTLITTKDGPKFDATDVQYNTIPKIGIGYDGKVGNSTFGVGFGYNTYKEKNDTSNFDEDINAFLLYARAAIAVGAVKVSSQVHYGQNLGNFGIVQRPHAFATLNATGGVDNTDGWGGFLQVGTPLTQMVTMNVGAGFVRDKQADTNYDQTTVYVNFPIKIADGFHVVPEFDYFHYNKAVPTSAIILPSKLVPNLKDVYVFGAKWQMDF